MSNNTKVTASVGIGIAAAFAFLIGIGLATGAMNLHSVDGVLTVAGPVLIALASVLPVLLSDKTSSCSKGCIFRGSRRKPAEVSVDER